MKEDSLDNDTVEEKLEEIEESLVDLLIFPTQKGLRRSMDMIEAYSLLEVQMMKQRGISEQQQHSTIEEQQHILNIARNELNNRSSSQVNPESCWIPKPKPIDKGIDKNVATRLASSFMDHAERVNDLCAIGEKK
jgi:hypothetical protein